MSMGSRIVCNITALGYIMWIMPILVEQGKAVKGVQGWGSDGPAPLARVHAGRGTEPSQRRHGPPAQKKVTCGS